MVLATLLFFANLPDGTLIIRTVDGKYGPTDAAGTVVTGKTLLKTEQFGLHPEDFLARHDAYNIFNTQGDLLEPELTQTNVNDFVCLFSK